MKLLLDFFPIILFFIAFKFAGIYVATAVAIVATIAQIAWLRYSRGKVEPMQWISLGIIVLFGGATIISQNETFIKWKPTVLYWLMAATLASGQLFFRKNLLKSLMGAQLELPDNAWRVMNWSWIGFFTLMGIINLWVAYNFDTDTWVNFKLFGGLGLMAVFVVGQALYLGRYMKSDESPKQP
ncbi:septation protein A [Caenimonas sp. SL110]|uniref:septation protein A n=1 Tax=Caenimonas sp. SL110 TaxID=1450524 RepID=UPI000652BC7E|nr:septation protein A [Caenimonas sp. SL110]